MKPRLLTNPHCKQTRIASIANLKFKSLRFKVLLYTLHFTLYTFLMGCDAFVRKFTRKPRKDLLPKEEMVLVPEEWKGPQMTKEELYRQYFNFWKSWQDELIESLSQNRAQKKQLDCIEEAIKNLVYLRTILAEEKQKRLDIYLEQLNLLRDNISKDLYGSNNANNFQRAERIKRSILRDFSYNKVKNYLL